MSAAATSKSGDKSTLLLSTWIRRAIEGVDLAAALALVDNNAENDSSDFSSQWPMDIRNSMALCSSDYLLLALKVTCLLADFIICELERDINHNIIDINNVPPRLPPPGKDWADKVQVHLLSDNGSTNMHLIEKVDFVFDGIESEAQTQALDDSDGMRRICSLGLVFYEIFSGGERPAEFTKESREECCYEPISEHYLNLLNDEENISDLIAEQSLIDDAHEYDICKDSGDHTDINVDDGKPRKRQSQGYNRNGVGYTSMEALRAKCLPASLCDLVANMVITCGEDSYCNMLQVRDDLQLMLHKPAIYLFDQDMGRAGLQFGDRMFGRNVELSTVKDVYRRSALGGSELVLIVGKSGYGKSLLAHEFGKYVLAGGGIVLKGKFDQLQQGKPLSALASALDAYCGVLLGDRDFSLKVAEIASKLRILLGNEASYLTKLIPNLTSILGSTLYLNEDCDNAQKRLQYLLCKFLGVIASTFSAPVTLFLDDLQWADTASMEAVLQLLVSSQGKSFFFVGSSREGAMSKEYPDPVWRLLCDANKLSVKVTKIMLDTMNENAVDEMVSETLCLSPRLTRPLSSIIYRKTNGNPLFVSRLMIALSKEGLLRPSLNRRRWVWDKEKIEQRRIPDDVAMFLKNSIKELPVDAQSSLCTLSCFGATTDKNLIHSLERALNKSLSDDLDDAVAKGLLDKIGDRYSFSHDRIQEAAYNMMPTEDRCLYHFTYGLALSSLSLDEDSDDVLFIAVNQLNHGGTKAVENPHQSFTIAEMNLKAGKKAIEMSDFEIAFSYFDHGISFLRRDHWNEHYDLSLELFELGAKCALTNSDHTNVKLLYKEVLAKALSFEDTLEIRYTHVRALYSASWLDEALTNSLYVLNTLGVTLSEDSKMLLSKTKLMLAQYSDEELLTQSMMIDRAKLMTMKFLSIVQKCLFHTNPKSQSKATLQMIQYSLRFGMCGLSSVGFAFYGSYLAYLGEIPSGYRYVKLAIRLAEKLNARDCMGDVLAVGGQVFGFVEPLQSVNDVIIRGHEYSLKSGDVSGATLSLASSIVCEYWSGKQLEILKSTMDDVIYRFTQTQSTIALMLFLPLYRSTLVMMGNAGDVPLVLGSRADVESEEERKMTETNMHLLKIVHFNRMYVAFMFRRYDEVMQLADAYYAIASLPFSAITISHCNHAFYGGLINYWLARKTGDSAWSQRGDEVVQKISSYANSSSWNFSNKLHLLQAEQSFHKNEFESATRHYDSAISYAEDYKFLHEEALASELAGYFMFETGKISSSLPYFLRAQTKYHEW